MTATPDALKDLECVLSDAVLVASFCAWSIDISRCLQGYAAILLVRRRGLSKKSVYDFVWDSRDKIR